VTSHGRIDASEWVRWLISGALVLCAHAAAATIVVNLAEPIPPGAPESAIVVDLAPFAAAPDESLQDLAPGPLQQQVEAPPEVDPDKVEETPPDPSAHETVEAKPDEKPVETRLAKVEPAETRIEPPPETVPQEQPVVEPAPLAPKPEATVAVPVHKPPPPPQKKKATRPMQLATAPTRPPKVDERAVAPSQGMPSPASRQAALSWNAAISAALERSKRYPADAKSRNEQGTAVVAFSINRSGQVLSSRIARTSGYPALDQETLATVARASLPPAPPEHPGAHFSFSVPIRFNIR